MKKVLVGGCFNLIHPGHIYFLNEAKKLGDYLIVVLTHDKNNKKEYAVNFKKRKIDLDKLKIADKIIMGNVKRFDLCVRKYKPDVIGIGYDQKEPVFINFKKEIIRLKKYKNYSTKNMIKNKLTKKDIGKKSSIKNLSLINTSDAYHQKYIWLIANFRTKDKEQEVDLVSEFFPNFIWRTKIKNIELCEDMYDE